jgi:hypothetical protein
VHGVSKSGKESALHLCFPFHPHTVVAICGMFLSCCKALALFCYVYSHSVI